MVKSVNAGRSLDRAVLHEVIPLGHPLTLFIDTLNACNFQCRFCPTGDRELIRSIGRRTEVLPLELLDSILADLEIYGGKIATIYLYKDGEPLLNRNLPEYIRRVKQSGVCREVAIITNATLLTQAFSQELMAAGLDKVIISLEGMTEKTYRDFAKARIRWDSLVSNIRYLHAIKDACRVNIKINADIISPKEQAAFLEEFSPFADNAYLEHTVNCWPNFTPKVPVNETVGVFGQERGTTTVCPYIFYSLAVNSNGAVSLCCADWAQKLIIGDLKTESFDTIWRSKRLRRHRLKHLHGARFSDPICGTCGHPDSCALDSLDEYATQISARF